MRGSLVPVKNPLSDLTRDFIVLQSNVTRDGSSNLQAHNFTVARQVGRDSYLNTTLGTVRATQNLFQINLDLVNSGRLDSVLSSLGAQAGLDIQSQAGTDAYLFLSEFNNG